jgi:hypothetical protein
MNLFIDAAFATRLASGPEIAELSLLQVLEAAERGQLVDLARLRPYQRPSVVSVLAIMLHLGRRYSGAPFAAAATIAFKWPTIRPASAGACLAC